MDRLVYSPSIKAWIKTDTGVVDLSPYITDCKIERKINEISKLEVIFRNPKVLQRGVPRFLFTQGVRGDGNIGPVFHPMDPITVVLQRIANRPIQVFTGYCDTVPYVQLFPGLARITASCTLKRLEYTYWDPALKFVSDFMKEYGWLLGTDGVVRAGGSNQVNPQDDLRKTSLNDSSIGHLLYAVLNKAGGWNDKNIYIQPLPNNIGAITVKLFDQINKDNKQVNEEISRFLRDIIGNGEFGQLLSGSTTPGASGSGVTMVGDSITYQSKAEIEQAMPGIVVYSEGSKHFAWGNDGYGTSEQGGDSGLKILKDNESTLGGVVVVALGTNDDPDKQTFGEWIDKAMTHIGSNKKAVFVTVTNRDSHNAAMREAKSRHSNIYIADWKAKAELQPNDVHPTVHGRKVFADVIAEVVNDLLPAASPAAAGNEPTHTNLPIPQTAEGLTFWETNNRPKIIVLHVTEGPDSQTLQNLKNGLMRRSDWADRVGIPNRGVSVHVGIDKQGNSARYVNDENQAHHCGYRSENSLGIEHVGQIDARVSTYSDDQINKSAEWVAYWSTKWNIPLVKSTTNGVCGHHDLGVRGGGGTNCPGQLPIDRIITKAKQIKNGQ